MCEAIWKKDVEVATLLLNSGARIIQSYHLLHYTVLHRHPAMTDLLLHHGAASNLRDLNGDTPLLLAARTAQLSTVKMLIQHGKFLRFI